MKALIIARVSTPEQKEANNSLPAQLKRLKTYCKHNNLDIVAEYSIDESAYKTKRKTFDKIIEKIEEISQYETIVVCLDKVDRLTRNVFDKRIAKLSQLVDTERIELHFVSDNTVINRDSPASQKFQYGISLNLAKYYSDAISDNVKRAFENMYSTGRWITKAPIGYKNTKKEDGTKWIVPDPEYAEIVIKLFKEYATNRYSLSKLRKLAKTEGLRNRKSGKPLSRSQIAYMLNNPFYYGYMRVKNNLYKHNYYPLISKELFDRVQQIKHKKTTNPYKNMSKPFIFKGLARCAECGCSISFYTQKGHVYGRCTNYKGICESHPHVRENFIEDNAVKDVLEHLSLPEEMINDVIERLKQSHKEKTIYYNTQVRRLQTEKNKITDEMDKAMAKFINDSITKEMFDNFVDKKQHRLKEIEQRITKLSEMNRDYYFVASTILSLSKRAYDIYNKANTEKKNELLKLVFANLEISKENVVFTLNKPFDVIYETQKTNKWLRGLDSNQQP